MSTLSRYSVFFLWEGILLILLGFLMLIMPYPSSLAIEFMIGITILIAGIIQAIGFFELHQANVIAWPFLLTGVIAITTGILLIIYPFTGLKIITSLVVIYIAAKAILEFIAAFILNINNISWWLIANGLIQSLLVIYIWKNWSSISLLLLGILVGINLLSSGIMRIMLSVKVNSLLKEKI